MYIVLIFLCKLTISLIDEGGWGGGGGWQERNNVFLPSIREPCKQVNGVFDWCNTALTDN